MMTVEVTVQNLETQFPRDLAGWVKQTGPASVLAIGRRAGLLLPGLLRAGARLETVDCRNAATAVRGLGAFDLAVVTDTVEHMGKPDAEQLLGSLRDLHAHHLLLLAPMGKGASEQRSTWAPGDLLAMGMSRVGDYDGAPGHFQLYHFALETYKLVPDWLNSKYWAHPERFDTYED